MNYLPSLRISSPESNGMNVSIPLIPIPETPPTSTSKSIQPSLDHGYATVMKPAVTKKADEKDCQSETPPASTSESIQPSLDHGYATVMKPAVTKKANVKSRQSETPLTNTPASILPCLDHGYATVKKTAVKKNANVKDRQSETIYEPVAMKDHSYAFTPFQRKYLSFDPIYLSIQKELKKCNSECNEVLSEKEKLEIKNVLATGNIPAIVNKVLSTPSLKHEIDKKLMTNNTQTAGGMGNRKNGYVSVLMKKDYEDVVNFSWTSVCQEFMDKFPETFKMLVGMMCKASDVYTITAVKDILPKLGLIYAITLQHRNLELSKVQQVISILLQDSVADQKVKFWCLSTN